MEEAMTDNLPAKREDTSVAVHDEVIEEVAAELTKIGRRMELETACMAGKLLIDKFYGGDFGAWHARGEKDASFRKLAERKDIPFKAPTLYRFVAIYEVLDRFGDVSTWKHLGSSHVRAVLGLKPEKQLELLESAEEGNWTVAEIEKKAKKARKKRGKGGRNPLPQFVKSINYLERYVDKDYWLDIEMVDEIKADKARELYQTLAGLKLKCEEIQNILQSRVLSIKTD